MYINLSYDQEFSNLMFHLQEKYPNELMDLEGLGKNLDIVEFSKQFFSKTIAADSSIDENANVSTNCIITYRKEVTKPLLKLNSFYILWKMLRRDYGTKLANEIIEYQISGDIYIHDAYLLIFSYCFNFSMLDIIHNGLKMITKIKSLPPQHLYSFKSQVEQFIIIASNSLLGASGVADILICMSYYIKKILETKSDAHFKFQSEEDCWVYIKESIASLIYTLNQPMRGEQAPFVNISIYDKYFLEETKNMYIFPDGSTPDIEIVQKVQDIFLTVMNEELSRTVFTFPVTTACFAIDDDKNIKDEEFAKFITKHNKNFGFINIFIGKSSMISSCCFHKDTKVLAKSSNGILYDTFETIYNLPHIDNKENFTVFHNGSWVKGKINKIFRNNKKLYKITTSNNKEIIITEDHINPTLNGDKPTTELTNDDYLLYNNRLLNTFPEQDKKLTYEQGYLIGLYLGDGSKNKSKKHESYTIVFSMGFKDYDVIPILKKALKQWNIPNKLRHYEQWNNVLSIQKNSKELYNIINYWVYGNYAYEKELNMECLLQSKEFRQGIVDGWYKSDGGNSNRIYSNSKKLIEHGEILFTSLGINTIINVCDRTGENKVKIRNEEFNRNYPLFCIRWYDMKNKRSMDGVYIVKNNCEYFKIKNIEEIVYIDDYVYCFEIKNQDEPYFTLPNGVITHNCRLISDKNNDYINSIGGSSSKLGSISVVTINLPRLSIKHTNKDEFMEKFKYLINITGKINNSKRKILKRKIDDGYMPLYTHGYISLDKQYSTTGINGLYECLKHRNLNILDENGQEFAIEMLSILNNEIGLMSNKYKSPHNCEQTPSESLAIKLCKKDTLLGYNPEGYKLYSNQFIPLINQADMLDRIKIQGLLDGHFSGGSICHINIDNKIEDDQKMIDLIKLCAKKGVRYFGINYEINECEHGHISVGKGTICDICGGIITDKFHRVVGFITNTKTYAAVRREWEYPRRQFYKEL